MKYVAFVGVEDLNLFKDACDDVGWTYKKSVSMFQALFSRKTNKKLKQTTKNQ